MYFIREGNVFAIACYMAIARELLATVPNINALSNSVNSLHPSFSLQYGLLCHMLTLGINCLAEEHASSICHLSQMDSDKHSRNTSQMNKNSKIKYANHKEDKGYFIYHQMISISSLNTIKIQYLYRNSFTVHKFLWYAELIHFWN